MSNHFTSFSPARFIVKSFVCSSWTSKGTVKCQNAFSCLVFFKALFFTPSSFVLIWNESARKCAIEAHHASTRERKKKSRCWWNMNEFSLWGVNILCQTASSVLFLFSWIIVLGLSTRAAVHGPKNTGWTKAVTRRSYHDVVNHTATVHCSSSRAGKAVELLDLLTAWLQPTDLQWHYVHPPSSNTDKELYAHHLGPKWPCSKLSRLCLNGLLIVFFFYIYII